MRNLIIFLSTFTLTILIVIFASDPAVAGGAGGSWGCPDGWTTKPDGSCSFDGGGGGFGGGGAGSTPPAACYTVGGGGPLAGVKFASGQAACNAAKIDRNYPSDTIIKHDGSYCKNENGGVLVVLNPCEFDDDFPEPPPPPPPPPPDFPDIPPPNPDCDACQSLYEIKLKLNHLKNQDINNITNVVNNMNQTINNIDNSITSLNVEMNTVNNNLTTINNNMGDLITNIENNNITNNEILNVVNNIDNSMTEYSLKLGDIEVALGDIDVNLDNTNKLVLDLGLDIDFIKNKLVNDDSKDYTDKLNEIIELLKPCEPTEEKPCPDDEAVLKKLKEIQNFMEADFVPDTDSTAVEVEDLTNIDLDRNLIQFGVASCPPDEPINTLVNGFAFTSAFNHKPLCDFFLMLAPFVKAFGGFSAALILGGGLRRG